MTSGSQRDDPPKRRKARPLADDDVTLWQRIARSIAPLPKAKPRVPEVEFEPPAPHPLPGKPPPGKQPGKQRSGKSEPAQPGAAPSPPGKPKSRPAAAPPPRPVVPRPPAPQPALERRHARRIAAGTIEIEARLDLHGLTQSAAYDRLLGFIQGAAASGLKTVLVITGKGGRRRFLDGLHGGWGQSEGDIGVLRSSVPRWLAEPPLRSLVVGYQNAAVQHGGDGAFYVQLRRGGRKGPA